jgi:hypothetical protein
MLFYHLFEHKPPISRQFCWSHSYHGWAFHQARWITMEIALVHGPLIETAEG